MSDNSGEGPPSAPLSGVMSDNSGEGPPSAPLSGVMSDDSGEGPPSSPLSGCGVPDDAETTPWLFRGKDLSNDLAENLDNVDWEALEFRSWGIFPLGHPVRTWCHAVERSSGFKALVVAGVILSVVAVMAELDATEGSWINEPVAALRPPGNSSK